MGSIETKLDARRAGLEEFAAHTLAHPDTAYGHFRTWGGGGEAVTFLPEKFTQFPNK